MECSVILLSPSMKETLAGDIKSFLSRADDETMVFTEVEEDINHYDVWLANYENGDRYYMLAYTLGNTYFIARIAGGGGHDPWEDLFEKVGPYAKSKDCVSLLFQGRKAWEKKLSTLDFKIKEYVFEKRLDKDN